MPNKAEADLKNDKSMHGGRSHGDLDPHQRPGSSARRYVLDDEVAAGSVNALARPGRARLWSQPCPMRLPRTIAVFPAASNNSWLIWSEHQAGPQATIGLDCGASRYQRSGQVLTADHGGEEVLERRTV